MGRLGFTILGRNLLDKGGVIAMPPLILTGDTVSVRLESRHLEVIRWLEKGTKVEARIRVPLVDIDRVVIVGRPNVTIAV